LLVGRGKKQFKLKTCAMLFIIQSITGKRSKYQFSQKGETGQPKNLHTHDAILYRRPAAVVVVIVVVVVVVVGAAAGFNTEVLRCM
jgi:ABC-type Fe3+ transport system permease subunit